MKIIVASRNPVKVEAAILGFESYFSEIEVNGVSVESGVPDQPMSDVETLKGAQTRIDNAKLKFPEANYWVGIEGGIENGESGLTAFAWIVICDGKRRGQSRTCSFCLPLKVAELIEQGYELGKANDILFKKENSKQKAGAVGILTKNQVNRTALYKQAVQLALIPFVNSEIY